MEIPKIFISYAWKDREQNVEESREKIVNDLCKAFETKGHKIIRDKSHLTYKDSIKNFMQEIGKGNFVIVIVSYKYLLSEYCMFEAVETFKHGDFRKRVLPIVLNDANIFDFVEQVKLVRHWEVKANEYNELAETIKIPTHKIKLLERVKDCEEIARNVENFLTIISDMNVLTPQMHIEQNFEELIQCIETKFQQENNFGNNNTNENKSTNNEFKSIFSQIEQQLIKNGSRGNVWLHGDYMKRTNLLQKFNEIYQNNEVFTHFNQQAKVVYFNCSTVFDNKYLFHEIAQKINLELELNCTQRDNSDYFIEVFKEIHKRNWYIVALLDDFDCLFNHFDVSDKKLSGWLITSLRSHTLAGINMIRGNPKLLGVTISSNKTYEDLVKELGYLGSDLNIITIKM